MKLTFCKAMTLSILLSSPLLAFAQQGSDTAPESGHGSGRMAEKFKAADTNGDGQLSKAEMDKGMPRLAQHFDQIDSNHDGQATPAEIKAYMQTMKAAHSSN